MSVVPQKLLRHGDGCPPTAISINCLPSGVNSITFELAADCGHVDEPIMSGARELVQAIGAELEGATRIQVRVPFTPPPREGAPHRLTAEAVKAERLSSLRRRDPALDAAVRELDLELMD